MLKAFRGAHDRWASSRVATASPGTSSETTAGHTRGPIWRDHLRALVPTTTGFAAVVPESPPVLTGREFGERRDRQGHREREFIGQTLGSATGFPRRGQVHTCGTASLLLALLPADVTGRALGTRPRDPILAYLYDFMSSRGPTSLPSPSAPGARGLGVFSQQSCCWQDGRPQPRCHAGRGVLTRRTG